ncbi:lysophospholipid acyltransferase family protein [Peijinzhouia sedimentorum]
MKKLLKILFTIWAALWFIGIMLLLSPFIGIPILVSRKGFHFSYQFVRLWVALVSFFTQIKFKVYGKENLQNIRSTIYVINHTSYLDAPAIPATLPWAVKALGKKELSKVPIFGQLVSGFAVWIDRTDPKSRQEGQERIKAVLDSGTPILISPEGTRNNSNELLLPFRNGAFRLAIETNTPITPLLFLGANKLMPRGTFLMKPGTVHCYILPLIPIEHSETVESYKAKVREVMILGIQKYINDQ